MSIDLHASASQATPVRAQTTSSQALAAARAAVRQRRALNPWGWWVWALGIAASAGLITNPLLLLLQIVVMWLVVAARRDSAPWARAFGLYVALAGFIVVLRLVMHVLVGMKTGEAVILTLPHVTLPEWVAGIDILGTVYLDGLVHAGTEGLRLGTIIIAFGAANSLANPKQLVRSLPAALGEVGTAIVIALSLAPQLAESLVRVRRARQLRGDDASGIRGAGRLLLPVLQETLDGALKLAASMDSRGYGRRTLLSSARRRVNTAIAFVGLAGVCIGTYVMLDSTLGIGANIGILLGSCALVLLALKLEGKRSTTTRYARSPWRGPEWLTAVCGVCVLAVTVGTSILQPRAVGMPLYPVEPPAVPLPLVFAILIAALPAFFTPQPSLPPTRRNRRTPGRSSHRA